MNTFDVKFKVWSDESLKRTETLGIKLNVITNVSNHEFLSYIQLILNSGLVVMLDSVSEEYTIVWIDIHDKENRPFKTQE